MKRAARIGFNTHVTVGERQLHVQTEVFGRDRLRMLTTVTEGGEVLVSREAWCDDDLAVYEEIQWAAEQQHESAVSEARAGERHGAS